MPQNPSDPDYDLHSRLGFRLSRLSSLMQARLEQHLATHEISRIEWCVLSGVGLQAITTPSALADHIGITRQAMSRLLVQMRARELLAQSFDQKDGRSRRLTLTDKGQTTLRLCKPLVDENQQHFASKIPAEQLALFSEALNTLLTGETAALEQL